MSEPADEPAGEKGNTSATAAVVSGAAGLTIGWFCGLFFPLGVAALFLGGQGFLQSRASGVGRGRAIVGAVLGLLALVVVPLAGFFLTIDLS